MLIVVSVAVGLAQKAQVATALQTPEVSVAHAAEQASIEGLGDDANSGVRRKTEEPSVKASFRKPALKAAFVETTSSLEPITQETPPLIDNEDAPHEPASLIDSQNATRKPLIDEDAQEAAAPDAPRAPEASAPSFISIDAGASVDASIAGSTRGRAPPKAATPARPTGELFRQHTEEVAPARGPLIDNHDDEPSRGDAHAAATAKSLIDAEDGEPLDLMEDVLGADAPKTVDFAVQANGEVHEPHYQESMSSGIHDAAGESVHVAALVDHARAAGFATEGPKAAVAPEADSVASFAELAQPAAFTG